MKYLFWGLTGLISLWAEMIFSNYLRIADLKINLVLVTSLILVLRWPSAALVFFGLLLGLMCDALSHSMLGVYGTALFSTLILARWIGRSYYNNNVFSSAFFIFFFSIIHDVVGLSLLKVLLPDLEWDLLFLQVILPLAGLHTVLSPGIYVLLLRFEKMFQLQPETYS